ncbi:MAG: EAL domain-containing protein [Marinobacterium sp.]|nr:EAL domain-containing protein [Marinobacterium sp.]
MKSRTILLFLALLTSFTAGGSALFYFQYTSSVVEREQRMAANQTAQVIAGELDVAISFHQRSVRAFSRLPEVRRFARQPVQMNVAEMGVLLQILCDSTEGELCFLLDLNGIVLAQNNQSTEPMLGKDFSFRPYFKQALSEGQSVYLAQGVVSGRRGAYFSQAVMDEQGAIRAVAVAKVPPRFLGVGFGHQEGVGVLLTPEDVVFASSRDDWLLKMLRPLPEAEQQRLLESRQFGNRGPEGTLSFMLQADGYLMEQGGARYLPGQAAVVRLDGWRILYLVDQARFAMRGADSLVAYVFIAMALVMMGVVVLLYRAGMRDRNHRFHAEQALRESESRLRRLTELSSEAIIIHHDGMVMDANEAAEHLFKYDRLELMQLDVWHLLTEQSQTFAREQEQHDNVVPYEVEGIRQGGERFPLEITAKHTLLAGRKVRVVCMRDISARKQQEEHMRYLALYDGLTRLPNRHNLQQQLDSAIQRCERNGQMLYLMFIDLDDFKKVNDSLGHAAGDGLLVAVTERLRNLITEGEVLARYGGDEFLVLLDNSTSSRAHELAEAVLGALRQPFSLDSSTFYISGSVGIACYPDDAGSSSELLSQADTAMYSSKDNGRNTWRFFDAGMNAQMTERIQLEQNLRHALLNNELYVEYQPVCFASSRHLVAAEALLRWHSPELGQVGPDRFIPVAEETGMIEEIGRWVMEQACFQARRWQEAGLSPFYISVNLSPRQFRDPKLLGFLADLLERTGLPAASLVVELTEGVLMKEGDDSRRVLDGLTALGVGIAMDDFGTGYSSLSYLKRFPFNTLKIDREFIRDLEEDPGDQQLIVATVAMARALGLRVVAEGVENEQQCEFLQQVGVDFLQGYLLSRPVSPGVFEQEFIVVKGEKSTSGNPVLASPAI